jgi:hypothetical protein
MKSVRPSHFHSLRKIDGRSFITPMKFSLKDSAACNVSLLRTSAKQPAFKLMTTTLSQISSLRPATTISGTRGGSPEPGAPKSLSQMVKQAVDWVDDGCLHRVAPADAGPAYHPRTLLAIMTYGYAREIYSSADIEDMLRRDQRFRQLCQNEFPDARVFRRFRRENRQVLQNCLFEVLRWLLSTPGPHASTPITDEDIALAASRRMSAAMFIDSMEQLE